MFLNVYFLIFVSWSFVYPIKCLPAFDNDSESPCMAEDVCKPVPQCPTADEAVKKKKRHGLIRCGFDGTGLNSVEIVCCPDFKDTSMEGKQGAIWEKIDEPKTVNRVLGDRKSEIACRNHINKMIPALSYHILGGENADVGEFPHMAIIGFDDFEAEDGINWKCGATLISEKYVLTAAHCAREKQGFAPRLVRVGIVDLKGRNAMEHPQTFTIRRAIIHNNYDPLGKLNDIALMELDREVNITENVLPACLYQKTTEPYIMIVTGWGHTSPGGDPSDILQKANIHSVPTTECTVSYERRMFKPIISTQICAVSDDGQIDTCQGDSGGPLQVQISNSTIIYSIVGVTSFGLGCGGVVPGVYTRVSSYLDWIESIVWPNTLN